jgi:hypothetical protein
MPAAGVEWEIWRHDYQLANGPSPMNDGSESRAAMHQPMPGLLDVA